MTATEAYQFLCEQLHDIYDDREGATIARYLLEDVFAKQFWSEEELQDQDIVLLKQVANRLLKYEPWQYIGGKADFYGLKFNVNSSVLIPRPETEELVFMALDLIKREGIESMLDIGTGSGIIPITIGVKSRLNAIFGLDVSEDVLNIAKSNNLIHGTYVNWIKADFLDEKIWPTLPVVDMVISNPPYITSSEKSTMHPNVLHHEPHLALFVRDDAMEFYDAIAKMVMEHQKDGCKVLVEINENFGAEVCQVFLECGLKHVVLIQDLQGKDRVVVGQK